MKKRNIALVLMILLCFILAGCTESAESKYERAITLLDQDEYDQARELFIALGEYEDSGKFVIFTDALKALAGNQYEEAAQTLQSLNGFKNSQQYIACIQVRQAIETGQYNEAYDLMQSVETFADSQGLDLRKTLEMAMLQSVFESTGEDLETLYAALLDLREDFKVWLILMDGPSMKDTFTDGDLLLVADYKELSREPDYGDIVICRYLDSTKYYTKRLIGLPGDTIEIYDHIVYRNGEALNEEYITPDRNDSPFYANTSQRVFADNEYYVLGDNRNNSHDSRYSDVGVLTRNQIIGCVQFVFTPYDGVAENADALKALQIE